THHLLIDGVSWRILLGDLQRGYEQAAAGRSIELLPKTMSFARWAKKWADYAASANLSVERAYWLDERRKHVSPLPRDFASHANTVKASRNHRVWLGIEDTERLLKQVPKVYRTEINYILLTALAGAFKDWTKSPNLLLALEGHGRPDLFDDVDLSRTVGWFTTLTPLLLRLDEDAPGSMIKSV